MRLKLGILWCLLSTIIYGQVNTEILRPTNQTKGIRQALDIDLELQSGNSDWATIGGRYRLDSWKERSSFFFIVDGDERRANNNLVSSEWFLNGRWGWKQSDGIWLEVFGQKEKREFLGLSDRTLFGAALRFSGDTYSIPLLDKKINYFYGVGLMAEKEQYTVSDRYENKTLLKSTNYISWKAPLTKNIEWIGVQYFQFYSENISDYRLLSEQVLEKKLTEKSSLLLTLNTRYDSKPPVTIRRSDTRWKLRLRFIF